MLSFDIKFYSKSKLSMKIENKQIEIFLPIITQANHIKLIKRDINLKDKESSIKLLISKDKKFEADLFAKTKYRKVSKSINEKLTLLKQNIHKLFKCQTEESKKFKTEVAVENILKKTYKIYKSKASDVDNIDDGLTRKNTKSPTRLQIKPNRLVSSSVNFKFFYKNKSIRELFNKKYTYNDLFK